MGLLKISATPVQPSPPPQYDSWAEQCNSVKFTCKSEKIRDAMEVRPRPQKRALNIQHSEANELGEGGEEECATNALGPQDRGHIPCIAL